MAGLCSGGSVSLGVSAETWLVPLQSHPTLTCAQGWAAGVKVMQAHHKPPSVN